MPVKITTIKMSCLNCHQIKHTTETICKFCGNTAFTGLEVK